MRKAAASVRGLLAGVLLAAALPALAQETADLDALPAEFEGRIAFVVLSRIFETSRYVDARRDEINQEFAAREQALEARVAELEKARQELSRDRLTLDNDTLRARLTEFEQNEIMIKRDNRDLAEDKRLRFDSAKHEVEEQVLGVIQDVARSRRALMVFELSAVLFIDKSLDITEEVIARLDEEIPAAEGP